MKLISNKKLALLGLLAAEHLRLDPLKSQQRYRTWSALAEWLGEEKKYAREPHIAMSILRDELESTLSWSARYWWKKELRRSPKERVPLYYTLRILWRRIQRVCSSFLRAGTKQTSSRL